MKKIILLIVIIVSFSCSKSKDEVINYTPRELIGTWKLVGYYDDNGNEPNGSNYHPYLVDTFQLTFNESGTFTGNFNGVITDGTYSVDTNSIINCVYSSNANLPISLNQLKISLLTNTVFETYNFQNSDTGQFVDIFKFEKNNNQIISGKFK